MILWQNNDLNNIKYTTLISLLQYDQICSELSKSDHTGSETHRIMRCPSGGVRKLQFKIFIFFHFFDSCRITMIFNIQDYNNCVVTYYIEFLLLLKLMLMLMLMLMLELRNNTFQ